MVDVTNIKARLVTRFFTLIEAYLDELEHTPVRGQFNKVFGTYSKSQNDLKKEYKGRLDTVMAMMTHFKVDTKSYTAMIPEPVEDDGILGSIREGE